MGGGGGGGGEKVGDREMEGGRWRGCNGLMTIGTAFQNKPLLNYLEEGFVDGTVV